MPAINFESGVFNTYRAVNKIHVGQIALDLPEGEIVQYDGSVMKWGGKEHNVPALAAAIRAGWLVVASDTTSKYVPKPGGVKVHAPNVQGDKQGQEIVFDSAVEDETVVGSLDKSKAKTQEALDKSAGKGVTEKNPQEIEGILGLEAKVASAPQMSITNLDVQVGSAKEDTPIVMPEKAAFNRGAGAMELEQEPVVVHTFKNPAKLDKKEEPVANESEGVPIAKIKTAAVQKTILSDTRSADSEIQKLDNTRPPQAKRIIPAEQDIKATHPSGATGDVSVAIAGDSLEELLPEAASSGIPVISKPTVVVSGFEWDLKLHWKKRVQIAVAQYGNDPATIKKICDLEMPQVAKHIQEKLAKK
jgi:hypothetical protein